MRGLLSYVARFLLWLLGWKVVGTLPPYKKAVAIGAFHTSNWDAFFLILGSLALRIPVTWMGKHTLFTGPQAFLFRWLGGFPIDRTRSFGAVDQVVEEFNRREEIVFILSPEGTRKRTSRWKRGFYEIARRANVPILLAAPDYKQKHLVIGPAVHPSGDIDADLEIIREFYRDKTPKFPENAGEITVAREYSRDRD